MVDGRTSGAEPADDLVVQLGRVGVPTGGDDQAGRVAYLADRELIIVVGAGSGVRQGEVVASMHATDGRWMRPDPVDLAAAQNTITVSAGVNPDQYVLVWQWRVWRQWGGGGDAFIVGQARSLAQHARIPGTVRVALTPENCRRVCEAAHMISHALRRLVARLEAAGLLGLDESADSSGCDTYTLLIPRDSVDGLGDDSAEVR